MINAITPVDGILPWMKYINQLSALKGIKYDDYTMMLIRIATNEFLYDPSLYDSSTCDAPIQFTFTVPKKTIS